MNDTPETDKAERMAYSQEYMVPTEFARRLERERDEARDMVEKFTEQGLDLMDANRMLKRERDEARRELDILRLDSQREAEHHDKLVKELENLYDKLKSQRS